MAEMNSETPSSGPPEVTSVFALERRVFVLFSIAVVTIMFVGMVGLLYWRERPAPSSVLILQVPPIYDGAIATVDMKVGQNISPVVTTLKGGQEVRVPLPPGEYVVKIEHPARRIWHEMILTDYSYYPVILEDPATTRPATRNNSKK